jgi:hypothetical protein
MSFYIWNSNWINCNESSFSLLSKFLYVNAITATHLKLELNEALKTFLNNVGISPEEINEMLSEKNKMNYPHLKICPTCINYGYHSNLHQRVKYCFIHGEQLISECKHCNRPLPYKRLTNKFYKSPYTCICGYKFVTQDLLKNILFNKCISSSNLNIKLTLVFENGIETKHFIVPEECINELFPKMSRGIDAILSSSPNFKFDCYADYGHVYNFSSDLFYENYEIINGLEEIVNEVFILKNYASSPFLRKLSNQIRIQIKQNGFRIHDFTIQLDCMYGLLSHNYYLTLDIYKFVFPLILTIFNAHLKKNKLNMLL